MKKSIKIALLCSLFCTHTAMAASPIPTFDKEAVTTQPYNRTGQDDLINGKNISNEIKKGNTGTEKEPSFYIQKIRLTGYKIPDKNGQLSKILSEYSNRSVKVAELDKLIDKLTEYCRICGYTVPQAVIPAQEIKDGILEVKVYIAKYNEVKIKYNKSTVADRVINNYITSLNKGDVITDKKLESVINNINDLPSVEAKAVLLPGGVVGTTNLDIVVDKRSIWNNYLFIDNSGGHFSGRYKYGFNTELNNPGQQGDKLIINSSKSNRGVKDYGIRYEIPIGVDGTRFGLAYSQSNYEIHTNELFDTLGRSKGLSMYGITPLYRDRKNKVTAIYGYDHRDIRDEAAIRILDFSLVTEKEADVWHIGVSGTQYNPNQFTQYSMLYWYGDIKTDGGAYYDGVYHKLTTDWLNVWYDKRFNYRINFRGQMANRALDGSEQFYLGGMNGVRAYGSSEGYGDAGWLSTFEARYQTDIEGLELATFIDWGGVDNKAYIKDRWDHLAGWGLGLRYSKNNDWFVQLDWARKINAREDRVEPDNKNNRVWFQLYKMF